MDERQTEEPRRWVFVGVLTIVGLAIVWWAAEQFTQIRIDQSDFLFPAGRLLGFLVTLIGAGLVFGLAVPPAQVADIRRRMAIIGWSLLLALVLVAFYSVAAFGWPEPAVLPSDLLRFLSSPVTVTASSLALGFYLSRLAVNRAGGAEAGE